MRLIDADKLIDYFYFGIYDKPIIDGISDRKIIDIIKNHPTAYSVDKVVEEFDKKYNNSLWIKGNEEFSITRNELIEIVKQGGVADDVCEWISVSDGEFIQNPHTKRLYSNEPSMNNVYCNSCGKKIKVVK